MSQAYADLVGEPPVCSSFAFFRWCRQLLTGRLAECPLDRTTTYYVNQASGSDSADGKTNVVVNNTGVSWQVATKSLFAGTPATWTRTPQPGEFVYVSGTGFTAGLYEVATANSSTIILTTECKATDGTGATVKAGPIKTINQANTIEAASSGDVRFRYRCGDVWRETASGAALGITNTHDNNTFDSYVDLYASQISVRKPIITAFTTIAYTSWTADLTYTNTYWATITALAGPVNSVGAVRYLHDTSHMVFKRVSSAALCDAQDGSYYYDAAAAKLYVHVFTGDFAPTTSYVADIEYTREIASGTTEPPGIGWTAGSLDGTRIHNLRFDGWGVSFNDATDKSGPIRPYVSGTDACVVSNCEGWYGPQHIFISSSQGYVGGICTWLKCRGGLGFYYQSSIPRSFQDVFFPHYASAGGGEGIAWSCVADGGRLPYDAFNDVSYQGASCRCHTDGTSGSAFSLMLAWDVTTIASQWQTVKPGGFANGPNWITGDLDIDGTPDVGVTPFDIGNARGFYVGTKFYWRKATQLDQSWWVTNAPPTGCHTFDEPVSVRINGYYQGGSITVSTGASWMYGSGVLGTHINETFDVRSDFSQTGYFGFHTKANGAFYMFNCYVHATSRFQSGSSNSACMAWGCGVGTNNTWAGSDQLSHFHNSILDFRDCDVGSRLIVGGLSNNLDSGGAEVSDADKRETNNAYLGINSLGSASDFFGVINDPYGIYDAPDATPYGLPSPDSNLKSANPRELPGGYTLQYDALLRPRPGGEQTRGPLEADFDPVSAYSGGGSNRGILARDMMGSL